MTLVEVKLLFVEVGVGDNLSVGRQRRGQFTVEGLNYWLSGKKNGKKKRKNIRVDRHDAEVELPQARAENKVVRI